MPFRAAGVQVTTDTGDMLMDEVERRKLKRAMDAARGKDSDQQIIVIKGDSKGGDGAFSKLKDTVFVVVVLGIGGVTWSQSISQAATNAKLETTVAALSQTVASLTQEVKELKERIKP